MQPQPENTLRQDQEYGSPRAASRDGRMPVAIIHRHGGRHADDLAVIRLVDLMTLLGSVPPDGDGS